MGSDFKCFIEIDDQRYDIIITEDISGVCFQDIYHKIQQILRLALNEVITYETHVFEVFENNANFGLIVCNCDKIVRHLSLIRVHRRQQSIEDNNQCIPQSSAQEVTANAVQSLIPHEYYCDYCSQSSDIGADPRLQKYKFNLNFDSYKQFSHLLETIKKLSNGNCDDITDYQWLNVIPYTMRSFGYKNVSEKLWKNSFELFRNKYIEVMEASTNTSTACSLFPFLHEFNAFKFHYSKDYTKKILDLRKKMSNHLLPKHSSSQSVTATVDRSGDNVVDSPPPEPNVDDIISQMSRNFDYKRLPAPTKVIITPIQMRRKKAAQELMERVNRNARDLKYIKYLNENVDEIRVYHQMIEFIRDEGLRCKHSKHSSIWTDVSKWMKRLMYKRKAYRASRCENRFYDLNKYYSENFYDMIETSLTVETQKTFDLLKVIHTIDLKPFYRKKSKTYRKLVDIECYLKDLKEKERRKTAPSPIVTPPITAPLTLPESVSPSDTNSTQESATNLMVVPMDLEERDVMTDNIDIKGLANSSVISPPLSNMSGITNGSTNSAIPAIPPILPVIRFDPRLDPRLRPKPKAVNTESTAVVINLTDDDIKPNISEIDVSIGKTSQNTQPLNHSIPTIRDPRLRLKDKTISSLVESIQPVGAEVSHTLHTSVSTLPSSSTKSLPPQPTQASTAVIRDPRLKRRLEQRTQEVNKQSLDENMDSIINSNKKLKIVSNDSII